MKESVIAASRGPQEIISTLSSDPMVLENKELQGKLHGASEKLSGALSQETILTK